MIIEEYQFQTANILTDNLKQNWADETFVSIEKDTFVAWINLEFSNIYGIGKVINYSETEITAELYTDVDGIFSSDPNIDYYITVERKYVIVGNFTLTLNKTLRQQTKKIISQLFSVKI